jgi:predicted nucleic acid-binding Zn finger protein
MRARFYDLGRYLVSSESGRDDYLVDVAGNGQCDCHDWRIRVDGLGEKQTCKHVICAQAAWRYDFPEYVRTQIAVEQMK